MDRYESADAAIRQFARRQLADYDAHSPGAIFGERTEALPEREAYEIQLAVAGLRRQRGESVAGYKVGCVSEAIRRQLGVEHPVFGHLYQSEIHLSPARLLARDFCELAIEGEFAARLSQDVDDAARLARVPDQYIESVTPVIELHNFLFRGPKPFAGELIANNALNAGIVISQGDPVRFSTGELAIRVSIGTRVDDSACVDPLESLPELVARLASFGIRPRAGDILLTGSPLPLYPVGIGDRIHVSCDGAAEVSATVRATAGTSLDRPQ